MSNALKARTTNKLDPRELPNYRLSEAAHYLRIPMSTLRWWLFGQEYVTSTGTKRAKPIIVAPQTHPPMLSFVNIVEAHVLEALRHQYKVRLPQVRSAVEFVSKRLGIRHPLADERFETNGVDLFVRRFGELINASRDGQLAIEAVLRRHLQRIDHEPVGLAVRLYPFTRNDHDEAPRSVVIDPSVAFGRPTIAGTGIATASIAERYKAGDSIADLAADYDRSAEEIEEALRCELSDAA